MGKRPGGMFDLEDWGPNKTADHLSQQLFSAHKSKRILEESFTRPSKSLKLDERRDPKKTVQKQMKRKHNESDTHKSESKMLKEGTIAQSVEKRSSTQKNPMSTSMKRKNRKNRTGTNQKQYVSQSSNRLGVRSLRNKYKPFAVKKDVNKSNHTLNPKQNIDKNSSKSDNNKIVEAGKQKNLNSLGSKLKKRDLAEESFQMSDGKTSMLAGSPREAKRKKKRKKKNNPKKNKYRHLVLQKSLEMQKMELKNDSKDKSDGLKCGTEPFSTIKCKKSRKKSDIMENTSGTCVLDIVSDAGKTSENLTVNVTTSPEKKIGQTLKQRLTCKLNAARFRYLNEQLYTQTGQESYSMFQNDEEAFRVYHEGFQSQVEKWPNHPLDSIVKYIRSRSPSLVVADFGCGDAQLARSLPNKVHSFDLVALNELITPCDMSHVPLKNGSVDVCVFCLSLMGTNLMDFLLEANRVLKLGGILKIAEVTSRFDNIASFVSSLRKLGFAHLHQNTNNKMFVLLDFKKISKPSKSDVKFSLLPCVYKRR